MGSFAAQTFREGKAPSFNLWDKKYLLAIKDRPNSEPDIREIGMDVQRAAIVVRVTAAQLTALFDQVLESGSLVLGWETVNAFLESITGVQEIGAGKDTYFATLNVIRL